MKDIFPRAGVKRDPGDLSGALLWFGPTLENKESVSSLPAGSSLVSALHWKDVVAPDSARSLLLPLWYILQISSVWYTAQYPFFFFFPTETDRNVSPGVFLFFLSFSFFSRPILFDCWRVTISPFTDSQYQPTARPPGFRGDHTRRWKRGGGCLSPCRRHWSPSSLSGGCLSLLPAAL